MSSGLDCDWWGFGFRKQKYISHVNNMCLAEVFILFVKASGFMWYRNFVFKQKCKLYDYRVTHDGDDK